MSEEILVEKVENRAAISKRDKSLSSVHASSESNGNEAGTYSTNGIGHCSRSSLYDCACVPGLGGARGV